MLEKSAGQMTPHLPLQLALAQRAPTERSRPAVSKLTAGINCDEENEIKAFCPDLLFCVCPADRVNGATVTPQPADSTSTDLEREETLDEGLVEDDDGEPNTAELRRRRLRKLETPSSSSSPPPDN